jgi:hypothetical protein
MEEANEAGVGVEMKAPAMVLGAVSEVVPATVETDSADELIAEATCDLGSQV